jgi:hypothetical protein
MMTSGSNCRHLNRPQTEEARMSIRPAYHGVTAKLQHFDLDPILTGTVKTHLVRQAWDETVRVIASIHHRIV